MKHLWAITCHKEIRQATRLCELLDQHFAGMGRRALVHLDGPGYSEDELDNLGAKAFVIRGEYQPSKCRGILAGLDSMASYARVNEFDVVSFLHSDMIPMCRSTFETFVHRFWDSDQPVAWSPMRPESQLVSFCALHWRPELAGRLFPLKLDSFSIEGDYNEVALTTLWHESCPGWRENAYPLTLANWPHSTSPNGGPNAKMMHSPAGLFVYHDYCLETSIVHTNDREFWSNYSERYYRS